MPLIMDENLSESDSDETKENLEEAVFIENGFRIDKFLIIALASILASILVIAQYYSPAPIWAIVIIALLLILFVWTLIVIVSLLNCKKITLNDIFKTPNLILPKFPKNRVFPYPMPKVKRNEQYQEQLYTDYIYTEDGWKSVRETCAICKRPYADLKHSCGAIFHHQCLVQYFSSLSGEEQKNQLCPHCYEPLYQEKPKEVKIEGKIEDLPEEEIEEKFEKKNKISSK